MKLKSIEMKDFCCFGECRLDLADQGLVCLVGHNTDTDSSNSNGSGKSTVFKALTWCLYGDTVDEDKGDGVIRLGCKEAFVSVVLEDKSRDEWTIVRKRSKGKPSLMLLGPEGKPVELGKDELLAYLNDILGLDFMSFRNSVLYGQNDSLRFTDTRVKDSDRKLMLHRMLKTDIFRLCSKWVVDQARGLKASIHQNESDIAQRERQLGELSVELIQDRMKSWEDSRDAWLKNKAKEAEGLLASANRSRGDAAKLKEVDEEIRALKEAIAATPPVDMMGFRNRIREHDSKAAELIGKVGKIDVEIKHVKDVLAKLGDGKCPLCESSMDTVEALGRLQALRERANVLGKNRMKLISEAEKETRKARGVEQEQARAQAGIDALAKQAGRIGRLERERGELLSMRGAMEADKKALKRMMADMEERRNEPNPYQAQFDAAIKKARMLKVEIRELKAKLVNGRDELLYHDFWSHGFSNQGLPSVMLDETMPFLTDRANHYLRILSDGDITMSFSTLRELKSKVGEMRDEIDISWTIEGQHGVQPSGGQRKKMEVATDLALMDLVSSREGELDLLLLDEVLDGLDREGCDRVMKLLADIRHRRGSIFLVSHEADLAYEFDRVVCVTKRDGMSTLEVE